MRSVTALDCRSPQRKALSAGYARPHDRGDDHRPAQRALQGRRADHGGRRGGARVRAAGGHAVVLCRCGHSTTKPFCDATHKRIGFVADDMSPRIESRRRRSAGRVESRRARGTARRNRIRPRTRLGRLVRRQRAGCRVVDVDDVRRGLRVRDPGALLPAVRHQRLRPRAGPVQLPVPLRVAAGGLPRAVRGVPAPGRGRASVSSGRGTSSTAPRVSSTSSWARATGRA